jgi:hypothetical protein
MSFSALAWASKYRAQSAAIKLVLFAYADRHNEETGCAYPSIPWLCEFTSLNRKTIISAVSQLESDGVLQDTGERAGKTCQIKVYRLEMSTVPKTEQSRKRNSTDFPAKQSQKRDTDTVLEPLTPVSSNEDTPPADPVLRPEHVVEAWNEMAAPRGLPIVKKLTPTRTKRLRTMIREHPLEDFTEAIDAVPRSPFLLGENGRGWKADFDFFLQPKSFTKLIEGSYDGAR